ncbi:MAG: DUF4221 family protein [Saprospiraceae bacterium]
MFSFTESLKFQAVLFLLIILTSSCWTRKIEPIDLLFNRSIDIPTNRIVDLSHRSNAQFYQWENTGNFIAVYTTVDLSIHVYDFDALTEHKVIDLSNLPNKAEVRAFLFLDEKTILVSTQLSSQYYIVNEKGEIIKPFNIRPKHIPDIEGIAYGNFNDGAHALPMLFIDNKYIVLYQRHFAPYPYLQEFCKFIVLEYTYEDSISLRVHDVIEKDRIKNLSTQWLGEMTPNSCAIENKMMVSAFGNPNIQSLHIGSGVSNIFQSPESNFIKEQILLDSSRMDDAAYITNNELANNGYTTIRYDPYHKLIYRIVSLATEDTINYIHPFFNTNDKKPFSIMIYDLEMKLLSEIKFPAHRYNSKNIIPTPEGLLLDVTNEGNPRFTSSKLQYDLFKIKAIE